MKMVRANPISTEGKRQLTILEALRADNQLSIQQDNLKLSKANLNLAQDRVRIGSASNADVYRWEANLAETRGLLFATLLTLLVVPVLYAVLFRVAPPPKPPTVAPVEIEAAD